MVESTTTKDKVGGGRTTVKTYTYRKEWSKQYINSDNFKKQSGVSFMQNCGAGARNEPWASDFPKNGVTYASDAKAGEWTLTQGDLKDVTTCGAEQVGAGENIGGFTRNGNTFESNFPQAGQLNAQRVSFTGDKSGVTVTALGKNVDGKVQPWTAPDSWLCSGYTLKDMRPGTHTKEKLFDSLVAGNTGLTWGLRIGFWLLL